MLSIFGTRVADPCFVLAGTVEENFSTAVPPLFVTWTNVYMSFDGSTTPMTLSAVVAFVVTPALVVLFESLVLLVILDGGGCGNPA